MKVQCRRDNTKFDATIVPYPSIEKPSTHYTEQGDRYIECPTCGRRYFMTDSHEYYADRPLLILSP